MSKLEKIDPLNRSIGYVLNIIGEGWSMLIIREAFLGSRRFEEFQGHLGIARNILTTRLKKLCAVKILDRVPVKEGAKRHEYILTPKGKEMMPLLLALTQWGDKWVYDDTNLPFKFFDRENGDPIAKIKVLSAKGVELHPRDIMIRKGPGAGNRATKRIDKVNQQE